LFFTLAGLFLTFSELFLTLAGGLPAAKAALLRPQPQAGTGRGARLRRRAAPALIFAFVNDCT